MSFNDSMSGYKKFKNPAGWTNASLLEVLEKVDYSFGKPEMGSIAKKEAIVFEPLIDDTLQVYIKASPKKIEIGRVAVRNLGKKMLSSLLSSVVNEGNMGQGTADADRAVEELQDVVSGLLENGTAENKNGGAEIYSTLYLQQKIMAITDSAKVFDEERSVHYEVKANLIGHKWVFSDDRGKETLTLKKKMVALPPKYEVIEDGTTIAKLKQKITLNKTEVTGEYRGKDISIRSDLTGQNFAIKVDGQVIGTVDRACYVYNDTYTLTVYSKANEAFIPVAAAIVDDILDAQEND